MEHQQQQQQQPAAQGGNGGQQARRNRNRRGRGRGGGGGGGANGAPRQAQGGASTSNGRAAANGGASDGLTQAMAGVAIATTGEGSTSTSAASLEAEAERRRQAAARARAARDAAANSEVARLRATRSAEAAVYADVVASALQMGTRKAQRATLQQAFGEAGPPPGTSFEREPNSGSEYGPLATRATQHRIGSRPVRIVGAELHETQELESLLLGAQALHLFQSERPPRPDRDARLAIASRVQAALLAKWPGAPIEVKVFGSAVTEIDSGASDVDLVLLDRIRPYGAGTPVQFMDRAVFAQSVAAVPLLSNQRFAEQDCYAQYYDVRKVADALRAARHFADVRHIYASVSIVKFTDRATGVEVDININERFGLINSQMIKAYADLRPSLVRPMIYFFKRWAARRNLNDPAGQGGENSLSSYTLALLVISHLQHLGLLPNLQDPAVLDALKVQHTFHWRAKKAPRTTRSGRPAPSAAAQEKEPAYDTTWYDPAKERAKLKELYKPGGKLAEKGESTPALRTHGVPSVDPPTKYEQLVELGECIRSLFERLGKWPTLEEGASICEPGGMLDIFTPEMDHPGEPYSAHFRRELIRQEGYRFVDRMEQDETLEEWASVDPYQRAYMNQFWYEQIEEDPAEYARDLKLSGTYAAGCRPADLTLGEVVCFDNFKPPGAWFKEASALLVQDPFILDRNTAQNVGAPAVARWKKEVQRANAILREGDMNGAMPNVAALLSHHKIEALRPGEEEAKFSAKIVKDYAEHCAKDLSNPPMSYGGILLAPADA